jgi:hypothetical protein
MGTEFSQSAEQQARVLELIERLRAHREVPRIMVGRQEGQKNNERGHLAAEPAGSHAPDPLLQLIREAPSMSSEQFLNDLKAQRLGKRRDPRIDVTLPVLLTGVDEYGRSLDQRVTTVNISRRGALLDGLHGRLRPGDRVNLAWPGSEKRALLPNGRSVSPPANRTLPSGKTTWQDWSHRCNSQTSATRINSGLLRDAIWKPPTLKWIPHWE